MSSGVKLLVCPICDKKFKFSSTYKIHIAKHTKASTRCKESVPALKDTCQDHNAALVEADDINKSVKEPLCNTVKSVVVGEPRKSVKQLLLTAELSKDGKNNAQLKPTTNKTVKDDKPKQEDQVTTIYGCQICKRTFSCRSNLMRHKNKHLGVRYQCDQCGRSYTSRQFLKVHLMGHKNLRPWACDECDARFLYRNHLRRHLKIHSGVRDKVCDQCGKTFLDTDSLRMHKQIHLESVGHECDICHAVLKHKTSFRFHMKLHKGLKEFTCDECNRSFAQKKTYNLHKKLHMNGENVRKLSLLQTPTVFCNTCNKGFANRTGLKKHLRKHELGQLKREPLIISNQSFEGFPSELKNGIPNMETSQEDMSTHLDGSQAVRRNNKHTASSAVKKSSSDEIKVVQEVRLQCNAFEESIDKTLCSETTYNVDSPYAGITIVHNNMSSGAITEIKQRTIEVVLKDNKTISSNNNTSILRTPLAGSPNLSRQGGHLLLTNNTSVSNLGDNTTGQFPDRVFKDSCIPHETFNSPNESPIRQSNRVLISKSICNSPVPMDTNMISTNKTYGLNLQTEDVNRDNLIIACHGGGSEMELLFNKHSESTTKSGTLVGLTALDLEGSNSKDKYFVRPVQTIPKERVDSDSNLLINTSFESSTAFDDVKDTGPKSYWEGTGTENEVCNGQTGSSQTNEYSKIEHTNIHMSSTSCQYEKDEDKLLINTTLDPKTISVNDKIDTSKTSDANVRSKEQANVCDEEDTSYNIVENDAELDVIDDGYVDNAADDNHYDSSIECPAKGCHFKHSLQGNDDKFGGSLKAVCESSLTPMPNALNNIDVANEKSQIETILKPGANYQYGPNNSDETLLKQVESLYYQSKGRENSGCSFEYSTWDTDTDFARYLRHLSDIAKSKYENKNKICIVQEFDYLVYKLQTPALLYRHSEHKSTLIEMYGTESSNRSNSRHDTIDGESDNAIEEVSVLDPLHQNVDCKTASSKDKVDLNDATYDKTAISIKTTTNDDLDIIDSVDSNRPTVGAINEDIGVVFNTSRIARLNEDTSRKQLDNDNTSAISSNSDRNLEPGVTTGKAMTNANILNNTPSKLQNLKQMQLPVNQNSKYACGLCDKAFVTANGMRKHKKNHHGINQTLLQLGNTSSNAKGSNHVQENRDQNSKHVCIHCNESFLTQSRLRRHKIRHHTDNQTQLKRSAKSTQLASAPNTFECKLCGNQFTTKRLLHVHMLKHKDAFTCNICGKEFGRKCHLWRHVSAVHTLDQNNIDIDNCEKASSRSKDANNHNNSIGELTKTVDGSSRVLNSLCDICGKKFSKKAYLDRHLQQESCAKLCTCNLCGKGFKTDGILRTHMGRDHNLGFACNLCDKSFVTTSGLRKHKQGHVNQSAFVFFPKKFECNLCEKRYSLKSTLNEHMLKHQGIKVTCDTCGKCFNKRQHLVRHISAVHKGIKAYTCDVDGCGKVFAYPEGLVNHKRTHSGDKPYQCSECGKCFAQTQNLAIHMKRHRGIKEFKCEICHQEFSSKMSMLRHAKRHEAAALNGDRCSKTGKIRPVRKMAEKCVSCTQGCGQMFSTKRALVLHLKKYCPLAKSGPC